MKIVHVIDYFHTDVCYQEFYLAKAQAEVGHDVSVVASDARHHTVAIPQDNRLGTDLLDEAGVGIFRLKSRQLGHDRAWLGGLEKTLRELHPDVVHCHASFAPTTVRTVLACRIGAIALLIDNHMRDSNSPGSARPTAQIAYDLYRATFGSLLRRGVGCWVAVGPDEAEFLSARLNLDASDIHLIPLGFDPSVFHYDAQTRDQLRVDRGWESDFVVVMTGKQLAATDGIDVVSRACERHPAPARLVLAGTVDRQRLENLKRTAPRLTESGRVHVSPSLDRTELADLYLLADVAVFARPSISVFEAAGSGLPVLLHRDRYAEWVHGLHPGIRSYESQQFVFPDPITQDQRKQDARAAKERLSWEVISSEFVDHYRRIVAESTRRPIRGWRTRLSEPARRRGRLGSSGRRAR
ncbi:MAG: glycosyltransferase family 4 protein [Actinomycetota bacterium]|nr:glycosyltransferase family 4 protein [Actinomycetota bacterium]